MSWVENPLFNPVVCLLTIGEPFSYGVPFQPFAKKDGDVAEKAQRSRPMPHFRPLQRLAARPYGIDEVPFVTLDRPIPIIATVTRSLGATAPPRPNTVAGSTRGAIPDRNCLRLRSITTFQLNARSYSIPHDFHTPSRCRHAIISATFGEEVFDVH